MLSVDLDMVRGLAMRYSSAGAGIESIDTSEVTASVPTALAGSQTARFSGNAGVVVYAATQAVGQRLSSMAAIAQTVAEHYFETEEQNVIRLQELGFE